MEKNEKLNKVILFFALCSAIAFVCGFADAWAFLAFFIFACAAATVALFKDRD